MNNESTHIRKIVEISEDEANELYRMFFLMNSQKIILTCISNSSDFNIQLYEQEKEKFLEYSLKYNLLLEQIYDKKLDNIDKKCHSYKGFLRLYSCQYVFEGDMKK